MKANAPAFGRRSRILRSRTFSRSIKTAQLRSNWSKLFYLNHESECVSIRAAKPHSAKQNFQPFNKNSAIAEQLE